MRKVNLLVMSGALGILCAASPAVFAQTAPPGEPKTNVGETKPPFKIPNGGGFKYKGKSSQDEVLLMEVEWQAAETKPNGTIRISGDVKYKNPKTEKMDVRTIDGSKSYITKTGELFFALNDIDGKVYGPVDLAAVEAARLTQSGKSAEDKGKGPGASAKETPPSEDQKKPTISNPSAKPAASSPTNIPLDSDSQTASKDALPGVRINDTFKRSGTFKKGSFEVRWKQANFVPGRSYPQDSKAITYTVTYKGKYAKPFTDFTSYLDSNGRARVWAYDYSTRQPIEIVSNEDFRSEGFKTLVKAIKQIKKENDYINKHGLKKLPSSIKDKKGQVLATDGTIILNAVIRSIKAHKIAHRESALAVRAFDNIDLLLKMDGMGWIVHRSVDSASLKVDHHKTRGRSLAPGQCSSYSKGQCSNERSFVGQYSDNASLIFASPTPAPSHVSRVAEKRLCEIRIKDSDVQALVDKVNRMRRKEIEEHANRLAQFLVRQRHIFPNLEDAIPQFDLPIDILFVAAREIRAGRINEEEFMGRVNNMIDLIDLHIRRNGPLGMTGGHLVNLILQMPGFQINNNLLANAMRSRVVLNMNQNLSLLELRATHGLPAGVIDLIRQFARLFIFRVAGKCDIN